MLKDFADCLNSRDPKLRKKAVSDFAEQAPVSQADGRVYNLHCHTFYSYNGYGFSPSYIAALAREDNWFAAGTVDFDVLDAVDEFLDAAKTLNVRAVTGIESRVFVQTLQEFEINSPGEPGIAYHMGVGFPSGKVPEAYRDFAENMRQTAAARTRELVHRVNTYLAPVMLDFEHDAIALTPGGNVTERHVCTAYRCKAEMLFPDFWQRADFWSRKLHVPWEVARRYLDNPVKLESAIRAVTMKKTGIGYMMPSPDAFPTLEAMNAFILACGAVPTICWLNGCSPGEHDVERLLDLHLAAGAGFLNIIPDRNWNVANAELRKHLVQELDRVIRAADARAIPIIVGTEMNAPGLKLVDDFEAESLAPYWETFLRGSAIACGHMRLTGAGKGYLSEWAQQHYPDRSERNAFFEAEGRKSANTPK